MSRGIQAMRLSDRICNQCLVGKLGDHVARKDQRKCAHATLMWDVITGKKENWETEKPMGAATFNRVAGQ